MPNAFRAVVGLLALAACERADSLPTTALAPPQPGPASSSIENPIPRTELVTQEPAPPEPEPEPMRPESLRRTRLRHWYALLSIEARQGVNAVCTWRKENPCGVMLTGAVDPQPDMLAALDDEERPEAFTYCDVIHPGEVCDTPLVVAFESEPIAFANHWPTASTPWLAMDRDGDGAITSRSELFGDSTLLAQGGTAANGFIALATLDDNHDGVIDHHDAAFARLLLWSDRNGDQTSSPSELRAASEILTSIPLANQRDVRCTRDDDCEGERGIVHWRAADGTDRLGAVVDVYVH